MNVREQFEKDAGRKVPTYIPFLISTYRDAETLVQYIQWLEGKLGEQPAQAHNNAMVPLADVLEVLNLRLPDRIASEVFADIKARHQ